MGISPIHSARSLPWIPPLPRTSPAAQDQDRIAVLGLGNLLLSDEGIGVHAAAALAGSYTFSPAVDILDGGTLGLDLLPFFQSRNRILIVDAVDLGKPAGYTAVFNASQIRKALNGKLSVHHIGLADVLSAVLLTREKPPETCLIGVQPLSLEMGLELTTPVQSVLDSILDLLVFKLREWKIECRRTLF